MMRPARIPAKAALFGMAILICVSAVPLNAQAASSLEQPLVDSERSQTSETSNDADISGNDKCSIKASGTDTDALNGHTDVFWGEIWLTDDGEPLSLYSFEYQSYPRLWRPALLDENAPALVFELLDGSGEVVGSVSGSAVEQFGFQDFGLYGEAVPKWHRYAQFRVEIQNPPAYDSIVLRHEDREIGRIERSARRPVVEIVSPECGDQFNSSEQLRLIWSRHSDNVRSLEYAVWYSVDNGSTYKLTELKDDKTFYPGEFGGASQVSIRVYASDGMRTSFDETHIEFADESNNDSKSMAEVAEGRDSECRDENLRPDPNLGLSSAMSTEVISGHIFLAEDYRPLRLEWLNVKTFAGFNNVTNIPRSKQEWLDLGLEPDDDEFTDPDQYDSEGNYIFPEDSLVLEVQLRDKSEKSVYSQKFIVFFVDLDSDSGPINDLVYFQTGIPNPPEYDSIAILHDSEKVGEVWLSKSDPSVRIFNPKPGSVFCLEDLINDKDSIDLSWSGFDPDGDDIKHSVWISTNGGKSFYRRGHSYGDLYAYHGFYESDTMHIRVYVTDGRRTAVAETYFEVREANKNEKTKTTNINPTTQPLIKADTTDEETECGLSAKQISSKDSFSSTTDFIDGDVILSPNEDPVSAWFSIHSEPRIVEPEEFHTDYRWPVLDIELRNTIGEPVHSVQHKLTFPHVDYNRNWPYDPPTRYTGSASFRVPIPNPPEYDSVAILYAGREIGLRHKSEFDPTIEILEPLCGSTYASAHTIKGRYKVYDLDGDRLNSLDIRHWYSIDEGETYEPLGYPPSSLADAERVFMRLYVTDGMRTSFDETYFDIISTEDTPEQPTQTAEQPAQSNTTKCQNILSFKETEDTALNKISTSDSTDVIKGELYFSDNSEPLRLEWLTIKTYPGIWEPLEPRKNHKQLQLVLLNENSDRIHSAPFTVYPSNNAEFLVRIPNPPEYESVAIYDSNTLIEAIVMTDEVPEIEIRESFYSKAYCHDDIITGTDSIYIGVRMYPYIYGDYDLWISTDLGKTYQLLAKDRSESRYFTLNPSDIYDAHTVFLRVYTTNGRRTAYDEIYFQLIHDK